MCGVNLNRGVMKKNKLLIALLFCIMISTSISVEGRMVNPDDVSFGISDSSIIDDNGGAIYVGEGQGPVLIDGLMPDDILEFSRNSAQNGGAIYNADYVIIDGAIFSDNSASDNGGAIYNALSGTINMSNVTVNAANGTALNDIYNDGTINANGTNNFNSNISGNGSVVNTGTMNLGGGTLSDTIQMTISNGSNLNITGGTANLSSNDTWDGTVNLTSGTLNVDGVSGTLYATGGNYNVSGTSTLGTGSLVTNGVTTNLNIGSTLNIDGGLLSLNSGDTWNGTVNLQDGTLCVNNVSGTLNAMSGMYEVGTFTTASIGTGSVIENAVFVDLQDGATLNIAGGTVNLDSNDHIIDGRVNLSSGTLNLDATPGKLTATNGNLNLIGTTIMDVYGSISSAVATNITSGAVLTNSGGTVNLDSNDSWNGQIVNNYDGIINTDNFVSNSSTASLVQTNGTLNVTNGSNLQLNSGSNISGGTINIQKDKVDLTSGQAGSVLTANGNILNGGDVNIDKYSQLALQSGQFNLNSLTANGSDSQNIALINTMNGEINTSSIGTLNIDNQVDFNIDIHARSNQYTSNDQFSITSGTISGSGIANVQDWALSGDIYG